MLQLLLKNCKDSASINYLSFAQSNGNVLRADKGLEGYK